MLCAVIMAGGKGTRFWPMSTPEKPKQFLKLLGEDTMLQMTVNRIKDIIPYEFIFIATSVDYVDLVKEQLPEIPINNIIIEPIGRNTAPCIALSAFYIKNMLKEDATMLVLPSDHLIIEEDIFKNNLETTFEYIDNTKNAVITLGIKSNRPETQYGYIKICNPINWDDNTSRIEKVDKFIEKPDITRAEEYIKNGSFLWNSGIYIWKISTILELIKIHLYPAYKILYDLFLNCEHDAKELSRSYSNIESISIDYGVMEKAENVYVMICDFGWDDIGNWCSIERYHKKDMKNNVLIGRTSCIDGENNVLISLNKRLLSIGLDNIFCIEADDTIIICRKDYVDSIKNFIKM